MRRVAWLLLLCAVCEGQLSDSQVEQRLIILDQRITGVEQRINDANARITKIESTIERYQQLLVQMAVVQTQLGQLVDIEKWVAAGVGSLILGIVSIGIKRSIAWLLHRRRHRRHRRRSDDNDEDDELI